MAPIRRKCIGQVQSKAIKMKLLRKLESSAARLERLTALRKSSSLSRATESAQQRAIRLQTMAERSSTTRAAETDEQRVHRLSSAAARVMATRNAESEQQHANRLQSMAERASTSRAEETEYRRVTRLQAMASRASTSRAAETEDQRTNRLRDASMRAAASRAEETSQQRDSRLRCMAERASTSRAEETGHQRTLRLQRVRESARELRSRHLSNLISEGFHYDPHKDYMQHDEVVIGRMELVCVHCHAKKFKSEPPGLCCSNGKVKLIQLVSPPEDLLRYTSGDTPESKHFLKNIRKYNSSFQMTSFGATSVVEQSGFPSTFTVQGQIYHRAGSLLPLPDQPPKFLQLYFIGNDEVQTDQRCTYILGTRRPIVLNLQKMFEEHNDLIKTFKTALYRMPTDDYKLVIRADRRPPGEHERRFNAPEVDDVAVVISGDDCDRRDIVIQKRSDGLLRISETHRSYDALQYPVIFPRGEDGYQIQL